MKIQKICEYLSDIGILQIDDINRFLKIYTQLSQNKYKNNLDKLILALFSYITLVSKSEQQLYEICKNIVNNFSNNQVLNRYKSLNIFNNIIRTKIHSRYILFLFKLNSYIFNNKSKIKNIINNNSNSKGNSSNDRYNNDKEYINNKSLDKNEKNYIPIKGRIINKKRVNKKKNIRRSYDISDDDKECTFSPRINHYYRPYFKSNRNKNINSNSNYQSTVNNENMNDNSNNAKFIPFKNAINYGYNNKINNEIEKMIINMSKYSNTPNNTKYLPKKTIYRKQINNIYPSNSYGDKSYDDEYNDNENIYHYYDEDYDFYQNENDHMKKVQDKILDLKLQKLDKISKECTFTPEINEVPEYLKENRNNYITDYNYNNSHRKYYKNDNINMNSTMDNRKVSKNKRINDEYADDYYNIYPEKLKKKKRARSYSGSKNEYSIYNKRKEELSKLYKEKYPFMPSIKYGKNINVKTTFDERQKQFIDNKKQFYDNKKKQEFEEIKNLKKINSRSKKKIKEIVDHLYDAEKIKEKVMNDKKEKSKKKSVINWKKRFKKHKQDYPEDYNKNKIIINRNKNQINNIENKIEDNVVDFSSFANNNNKKETNIDEKKNEKERIKKKDEINKNQKLLMDKIKDEHVIGFKNNSKNLTNAPNNNINIKDNKKDEDEKEKVSIKDSLKESIETSINLEERKKNFMGGNILDNMNNKGEIKSTYLQEIMKNRLNNK